VDSIAIFMEVCEPCSSHRTLTPHLLIPARLSSSLHAARSLSSPPSHSLPPNTPFVSITLPPKCYISAVFLLPLFPIPPISQPVELERQESGRSVPRESPAGVKSESSKGRRSNFGRHFDHGITSAVYIFHWEAPGRAQ
jgi:hypothetical protein